MCNLNAFIVFSSKTEQGHCIVLDNEFPFLKRCNGILDFQELFTSYTKQISDNRVCNALLFHNQWILCVGIEVDFFCLLSSSSRAAFSSFVSPSSSRILFFKAILSILLIVNRLQRTIHCIMIHP